MGLLGAIVVVSGVVFALHRFQVNRNAGGLASLAREKLEKGQTDDALGLFARYLSYRPDDGPTHAEFARLVVDRAERPGAKDGERRYAYNVLETAVRQNPDDVPLRTRLAEWMLRFGRYGDAAAELTVIEDKLATTAPTIADPTTADTGPDAATIGTMRARALTGLGKYKEAAVAAAAVIGFDLTNKSFRDIPPPDSDTRFVEATGILATLLDEKLDDEAAAERVLEHLTATRPDDYRGWVILADWQRTHGDLPTAAESAQVAARLAPDAGEVLFTNLQIAIDEGRLDVARKLADKARASFPHDDRGYRGLAAIALQDRDFATAAAVLEEALAENPGNPRLLLFLADVRLQAGQLAEAAEALAALAPESGKNPAIGLIEARLLIARKRWLAARQKLDEVRPLCASSAAMTKQIDLLLGQCHEQLGEFDEQLSANRRVLDEDDGSIAARVGMATALAASGKTTEALAEFEAVAAAVPAERLPGAPQIWGPLLQLRVAEQMRRPAADRDWSPVEALLDGLAASGQVPAGQSAILRADLLVRQGDAAGATQLLHDQVAREPTAIQPRAALASLTLRHQGPEAAAAVLDAAPTDVGDDPQLLAIRAQIAAQLSPAEGARILGELEERSLALPAERSSRLLATLASIHKALGDASSASRLLRMAAEKSPDSLVLTTARFDLACETGDLAGADELAAEIARLAGPTSPQGRVAAAATLILRVRGHQADKAAAPDSGPVAGLSDEDKERLTAAKNLLIEAENDRPGWPQTQQLFAEVAGLRGDIPTAIDRLKQAIALGPPQPNTVRRLVSLLYLANRFQEAQEALASVGSEGLVGMDRLSAEVELRTGQFDQAVASAERGLAARREQSAGDLLWFGQILARAGKVERAGAVLEQAVAKEPDNRAAWMTLLSHQISTGQRQAAEGTLQALSRRFPPPEGSLLVAQGDEMLGRIAAAENRLQAAAAAAPDDPAVNRSLAAFLIRRGRLQEARQRLQAVLDTAADPAAQAWARRALAELLGRGGGYRDVEQALALLRANVTAGGVAAAEDLTLAIGLLAPRPEPESWRQAVALLEQLAKRQPLTVAQRLTRADLHERLGQWDESRIEFAALASAGDATPATIALFVEKLLRHGELDMAGVWLKNLADRAPEAPIVPLLQARLALAEKDRSGAVAAVRRLLPASGDAQAISEGLAGPLAPLAEELGFEQVADRTYSQLAAASPDGILARAGYLGRTGRGDEAIDLLEASWSRLPLEKLLQAAVLVLRTEAASPQQRERVERLFAKARREDPDSVNVAILEAGFVALGGDDEVTERHYRRLLDREDLPPAQAAVIANNLAFLLARPETATEAERLVERAIDQIGPHPDVLDTRGVVRLAAGRSAEAVADLEEAVLVPSATKHLHLACALAAQKRFEAARRSLETAKRIGLDRRRLDAGDQARLQTLEAAVAR
jgi:tetratricopeptide (TPR) repeat protein